MECITEQFFRMERRLNDGQITISQYSNLRKQFVDQLFICCSGCDIMLEDLVTKNRPIDLVSDDEEEDDAINTVLDHIDKLQKQ